MDSPAKRTILLHAVVACGVDASMGLSGDVIVGVTAPAVLADYTTPAETYLCLVGGWAAWLWTISPADALALRRALLAFNAEPQTVAGVRVGVGTDGVVLTTEKLAFVLREPFPALLVKALGEAV